ncbi:MAG: carbohydrate kinase family protein, partial [Flavobacterium sp.]
TVIALYLATNPFVKLSDDDCFRYFGETKSETFILDYFHQLGAATICLTKGKEGVVLSDILQGKIVQPALPIVNIKDTTGAGDAFWTGFLYAQLQHKNLEETLVIAQKLAILKLQHLGGLPNDVDILDYLNC